MFQQRDGLDGEIDELWNLMQRCKRNCNNEVQIVIWMSVENFEYHYRTSEQQLQNKIWDPDKWRTKFT